MFWDRKTSEEKAADRLLEASSEELQDLRQRIMQRSEDLTVEIDAKRQKIEEYVDKATGASKPEKRLLAQKCEDLERDIEEARKELDENMRLATTVRVVSVFVSRDHPELFEEELGDLIGASSPEELKTAMNQLRTRKEMDRKEREEVAEIAETFDEMRTKAEKEGGGKWMEVFQKREEAKEDVDRVMEGEPPTEKPAETYEEDEEKEADGLEPA